MSPMDNVERRIEQLHLTTSAEADKRILADAYSSLQKGLHTRRIGIWQTIVNSRLARPIAAAAVLIIVVGLFLSRSTENADTVEGFYTTLAGVQNICVSTFQADRTIADQQVWTSLDLKVRLFKTETGDLPQYALLDIDRKMQMTVYLSTVRTEELTEQKLQDLTESMTPSFGLAPFFDAKDVPEDARWKRVKNPAVVALVAGCAVYDLTWVHHGTASDGTILRKWRVFIDAKTHRPRRAEFYTKSDPSTSPEAGSDAEYDLERFVVVTYPTKSEISELVASTFGQSPGRTGGPEYIGTPGIDR